MRTAGFSWILGRAFWEEFALLARTARSPEELDTLRRARLEGVLRAAGLWAAGGEAQTALAARVPSERGRLRKGLWWRRRTSGSSGRAVEVSVGRATYARMLAGFWRGMSWWGVTPGEAGIALLGASGSELRRSLLRTKDRFLGVRRVVVDDKMPWANEARALLETRAYAYVYGYPSALYELAVLGFAVGRPPRVVVATGEPLFGFQRRAIRRAFGAPVVEEFGCTELGTVAFECPQGGLHLTAEQVWLERVGARTLATSLLPRPVPLVRYPLDEPAAEQAGNCPCGLGLPGVVLVRRQQDGWRRFEAAAGQAAEGAGLPARFTVSVEGGLVRVPAEAPAAQVECLRAVLGPGARVERAEPLPRRAAGKFSYLEAPQR